MQNQLFAVVLVTSWLLASTMYESRAEGVEPKSYPVLSGVGIALLDKEDQIFVAKVVAKSPAAKSGLISEGARLVSVEVDGEETLLDGKTIGETASLIRGPVGTELVLSVLPPNTQETIRVTLEREPLEIDSVSSSSYQSFIGKPVPELALSAIDDAQKTGELILPSLDGSQKIRMSDHRGKVVVLDFWASWCPTCFAPVTKMQTLSEENPSWSGKVELITVTVDSDLSRAAEVINEQKWHSTQNCAVEFADLKKIGVSMLPVAIIIAPDGTIATMAGAHSIDIEKEVEALLVD
ncbi:MAG: thioredoxin-like domain-containing protein [Candidatus Paceibacterota bacterium]